MVEHLLSSIHLSTYRERFNYFQNPQEVGPRETIVLDGQPLNITDSFKYLGSIISSDGSIDEGNDQRIKVGWMKWKQLSSVLCDRKVPVKTKGKVYKTAVRPAILYGSECWAPNKKTLTKLHTTEMKMLR